MGKPSKSVRLAVLEVEYAAQRRVLKLELKARDTALRLQAVETERRLEALNNEAGRIQKVLEATLPREVGLQKIDSLQEKVNELRAAKAGDVERRGALSPIWGFAATLVGGFLLAWAVASLLR